MSVAAFIEAALSDLRRAEAMLGADPALADADFCAALVTGSVEAAEETLEAHPSLVNVKCGPRNWEPLLYVCFSRFGDRRSRRANDLVRMAGELLGRGADPNSAWISEEWPDNPLPCLYGATGLNNNPPLAAELLRAGAGPNDSESLYHSTEHSDLVCLKLLLENGASPAGTNALKHMLDREDLEGLRLLLRAGADPNEADGRGENSLHWAIRRGRGAGTIAALIEGGAQVNARRKDGRTAYALAIHSGSPEIANLLREAGADLELPPVDRYLAAAISGASASELHVLAHELPDPTRLPECERLIPDLTSSHRTSAVRALLNLGMPVDARGELGGTALHWACWKGYADLVALLLAHGASLAIRDDQFKGEPAGWFTHGLRNRGEGGGDYPQVARLLLSAGATIPASDVPTGNADVDAVLREYGIGITG